MPRVMRVAFPVGIATILILEVSGIFDWITDKMGIRSHVAIAQSFISMLIGGLILGVIMLVMSRKKPEPKARGGDVR